MYILKLANGNKTVENENTLHKKSGLSSTLHYKYKTKNLFIIVL